MTNPRRTLIAIVAISGDDGAGRMEQVVVKTAIFIVLSEKGEDPIVVVWVTQADLVVERLPTFEKEVFGR